MNIKLSKIFVNWKWGGIITGLLFKSSLFDSTPLYNVTLEPFVKSSPTILLTRGIAIGAVDANKGKF